MKRSLSALLVLGLLSGWFAVPQTAHAGGKDKGNIPNDERLKPYKTLNDYFPFSPPKTKKEWEKRRAFVRAQVKVGNGLWPLPPKTPLNAVIHGKIKRDGYTVEKVFFESYPGFYVTGNLYRPTNIKKGQKVPGVLCPHGHWGGRNSPSTNGRFYEASDSSVKTQLENGAEKFAEGAKYPLQARCANLAMLGCVVFHYDMVGYGDSTQIYHPLVKDKNPDGGFADPEAYLRLQNFMGLQTWNSIRSLDFLEALPEVDSKRLAVTGASGGGTQTFILFDVDDRPAVAFPAVMVSTAMQGGCICENCTYLRVGTGNIELAGLFAPRPLAMSGANDWTKEIETKGYPQLKKLYELYNAEDQVKAKAFTQFPHNYNCVAREFMYNWFNKHLNLGHESPVVERRFMPVPPKQLSVYDKEHPRPKKAVDLNGLRDYMTQVGKKQANDLFPQDAKKLKTLREIVGPALAAMMVDSLPSGKEVRIGDEGTASKDNQTGLETVEGYLTRTDAKEAVPVKYTKGRQFNGSVVVWIHPRGISSLTVNNKLIPAAQDAINQGSAILAIDPFMTGAFSGAKLPPLNTTYAGYTWGYNRTLLANRVHDILTAIAFAKKQPGVKTVNLVGFGKAGPWTVLASALAGKAVSKTAVDMNQFRFEQILRLEDEMMQPGALKYGGLPAFVALCAPRPLYVHNAQGVDRDGWIEAAYQVGGNSKQLQRQDKKASMEDAVSWLLK